MAFHQQWRLFGLTRELHPTPEQQLIIAKAAWNKVTLGVLLLACSLDKQGDNARFLPPKKTQLSVLCVCRC